MIRQCKLIPHASLACVWHFRWWPSTICSPSLKSRERFPLPQPINFLIKIKLNIFKFIYEKKRVFALHTPILIIEMSTRLIYLFTYLYKQRTTSWQELGSFRGLNYQGNSSFVSFVVVLYTQNRVATNLVQLYYSSSGGSRSGSSSRKRRRREYEALHAKLRWPMD